MGSAKKWYFAGCTCGICGHKILNVDHANLDHIIPKSKGGIDDDSNLQISHRWCNQYKADSLEGEFKKPSFAWNIKCLALYKMGLLKI
jgi:5-methylcytosine-specific restriction endonuclease McrA